MNKTFRKRIHILIDILIIFSFIWIVIALQNNLFHCDEEGWSKGWKMFKYFTNIGNLLLAISSLISLWYSFNKKETGTTFTIIRLCAVVCSSIIVLVTYTTLTSSLGWKVCFLPPAYLFEHTLLPLFAFLQFFIFDEKKNLKWYHSFYTLILPFLYALIWIIVLLILNLPPETEKKLSVVPYFFLAIHNQPVYLTILYVIGGLVISFLLGLFFIWTNNISSKSKANLH